MGRKTRVSIKWARTAVNNLKDLPPKVAKGILSKAAELNEAEDPRLVHKPLQGPLQGFYSMRFSRYRAIYSVREEHIASGDVLLHLTVHFLAVGARKEYAKDDVYNVAKKLISLGVIGDLLT